MSEGRMFKKYVCRIFSAILVLVLINAVQSSIPYESCENVRVVFDNGRKTCEALDSYGEWLVKNEYLMDADDPGSGIFFVDQATNRYAARYTCANQALLGMQFLFDEYINNDKRIFRPSRREIRNFFLNVTQCIPPEQRSLFKLQPKCNLHDRYRSFDGSCNNLAHPLLGTPYTAYGRKVDACYENYVYDIRKSVVIGDLPSPRKIVNDIYTSPVITFLPDTVTPNNLWVYFGQFFAHDLGFLKNIQHKQGVADGIRCCTSDFKSKLPVELQHFACSPFDVPLTDKYYGPRGVGCLNFVRSEHVPSNFGYLEPANQVNRVTGYADLSTTYGLSTEEANSLRQFEGGLLVTNSLNILPELDPCPPGGACYMTGDVRGNQTPQLSLIHSLFVRFHNFVAKALSAVNPKWNDETLFQETRRFVIAVYQRLLFEEYLPTLTNSRLDLSTTSSLYDPSVPGIVLNEFQQGVLRTYHFFLPSNLLQYSADGQIVASMPLSDAIGRSELLQSNYSQVLNGMLFQPIRLTGASDEIRNKVFGGFDMTSFDILRGRDHGLKPYIEFRKYCGFADISGWKGLYSIMPLETVLVLQKIYKSVRDIDLVVGLILENKYNQLLGPTSQCLIFDQFTSLKIGDRYFYSHSNSPSPFTFPQLEVINNFSFAKFLCLVTNRLTVTRKPLYIPGLQNNQVLCRPLRTLDLSAWKQ